jgi:Spy/CpxP family protein refolding chaperone
MVEARLQKMSQQLNLTDEQREKIRPILRNEAEELIAVRSNSSLTQGEVRRRARRIRRSTHRQIFQILTPEQQHQWQELQQERRSGGRGAEGPEAPPNPPNPQ